MIAKSFWALTAGALIAANVLAVTPLVPKGEEQVIEVLPVITRHRLAGTAVATAPADPARAMAAARQHIQMARQTGDTRYWGRAQSVLEPWWNNAGAPVDIAVTQATVQQGRHEFGASRQVLEAALQRAPSHAQGWLNLAALERLSAKYADSLAACGAVARAGQAIYADACKFETLSLQGEHAVAAQGLRALITQAAERADQKGEQKSELKSRRAWLYSLLAESQERAGQDGPATQSYLQSLQEEPDLYTAIAYSDLLLRVGKNREALSTLAALAETDAVLLRRGAAWKRLGDARWREALAQLKARNLELQRRGDDPGLHGRELALTALWLQEDAASALAIAKTNLQLQREPIDWWVALQSARAAGDNAAVSDLAREIARLGLRDARLGMLVTLRSVQVSQRSGAQEQK